MNQEESNTGQVFSTRDFSNVDDIISIIDTQKADSPETSEPQVDVRDQGIEFGVGRFANETALNNSELQDEKDSETTSEKSEGTQEEQSVSSNDTQVEPDAEESIEASNSQSEDSKESEQTDSDTDTFVDINDDEELVIQFDDGDEAPISQIIDEWQNNQNWQKSNTEKAQELADLKREFEQSISGFKKEEIQEALQNEELQEALDDWFEGRDKNPFREAVLQEPMNMEQDEVQESDNPVDDDRVMLEVEKEIFGLQKEDESLNDEGNLDNLLQYAIDNNLKLDIAHRLMQFDSIQSEFDEVKKELKNRNEELSKLKEKAQSSVPTEAPKGKGALKEDFEGSAGTWNGAENRVLAKLGLK